MIRSKAYAYVEPETFHPVEIVYGRNTYRFLAYEYLLATSTNLALTNIHAQHTHASILNVTVARSPSHGRHTGSSASTTSAKSSSWEKAAHVRIPRGGGGMTVTTLALSGSAPAGGQ